MRKLFEAVRKRLGAFIEQRDDLVLVVRTPDLEIPYILKTLQGIDGGNGSDLFWFFSHEFVETRSWVSTAVREFTTLHTEVNQMLAKDDQPTWPEVPEDVSDELSDPVERLRRLLVFTRSLLPAPDGHVTVMVLFPVEIRNPAGWADLVAKFASHEFPGPWCHHSRMIFRDDPQAPTLSMAFEGAARTQVYAPDLGQSALEQSLFDESVDEDIPVPERMQNVLMLAATDYSMRRYDAALEKYQMLLPFYWGVGDHLGAAMVLNGMGEVYERTGDDERALWHYEASLGPGVEGEASPAVLNTSLNLANFHLGRKNWEEAESYCDGASQIAMGHGLFEMGIQTLENRGYALMMLERPEDAAKCWRAAAGFAREINHDDGLRPVLMRLRELLAQAGRGEEIEQEIREIDDELIEVQRRAEGSSDG